MMDGSALEEKKFVSFSAKQFQSLQLYAARPTPPNTQTVRLAMSVASWKVGGVGGDRGAWGRLTMSSSAYFQFETIQMFSLIKILFLI